MNRPGIFFPSTEIGTDPGVIRDFVQAAEGLGFSHLLVVDHVIGVDPARYRNPGPYNWRHEFHEPLTFLAWAAGITTSIELVTGFVILPQRQTALVAKQAAQVQLLSGGRLRLGVGIGSNEGEYEVLGEDFGHRGKKLEAQLPLLKRLWSEELLTAVDDGWHRITAAGIAPRPAAPIPTFVGGMDDRILRRAARYADGWMGHFIQDETAGELMTAVTLPSGSASPAGQTMGARAYGAGGPASAVFERVRGYVQEEGRDPASFAIQAGVALANRTADRQAYWTRKAYETGAQHVAVSALDGGLRGAEHIAAMRDFMRAWEAGA